MAHSWLARANIGSVHFPLRRSLWFANEVGRSLVRSVEYGLQTQNLLDRDLLRLMNTMAICSRKFSAMRGTDPLVQKSCTWVFVRCFVEIGCQARTFTELPEDWFYSPAIHLLHLHDDHRDGDPPSSCVATQPATWRRTRRRSANCSVATQQSIALKRHEPP